MGLAFLAASGPGAAYGGDDRRTPGDFAFPRVREGHTYYMSEDERRKLQEDYRPSAGSG